MGSKICQPRKPSQKAIEKEKTALLFSKCEARMMCITGNLQGDGKEKEIPATFYSQVDAAHHIHVFKDDSN